MIALVESQRFHCRSLFDEVPIWRAFIESAIEDGYGHIIADDDAHPEAAVLFYSGLVIYAGDSSCSAADTLIRHFEVQPVILGYSMEWNRRIENVLGKGRSEGRRYHLPYANLRPAVPKQILEGSGREPEAIGADDYVELQSALGWEHHLHHYGSRDDFLENGNGFVLKREGRIVSGASSFVVSSEHSECQVTTVELERGKGFARLVSAAYLKSCLEKGLGTPWDAANVASVRLGRSLGFAEVTEYKTYAYLPS